MTKYLGVLALLPSLALALEGPKYWDNVEGLKDAAHCEISTLKESPFRISHYYGRGDSTTENLRNQNGVRQSHLENGSLVKMMNAPHKRHGYDYIQVLGVNLPERGPEHRWYTLRGDRGYLYQQSLRPIEDFELKLEHELFPDSFQGATWSAPAGADYLKLTCPEHQEGRTYFLFKVQTTNSEERPHYVGVSDQETELFKSLTSQETLAHETEQPLTLIEDILHDISYTLNPGPAPVTEETVDDFIEQTEELEVVLENNSQEVEEQEGLHQVVCTTGSPLNVRAENLEDVLFQARPGERITIRQGFEEDATPLTQVIGGKSLSLRKSSFLSANQKIITVALWPVTLSSRNSTARIQKSTV